MSKSSAVPESVVNAIVHKTVPTDGSIIHGMSVQGDINDIADIPRAEIKTAIDVRIKDRVKRLSAAKARLAESYKTRDDVAKTIAIPQAVYDDLVPIVTALQAFYPGAYVFRASKRDPDAIDTVEDIDYTKRTSSADAEVHDIRGRKILEVNRVIPLPDSLVALHATVLADEQTIAEIQNDLLKLREAKAGLDDTLENVKAAIRKRGLAQTDSGQAALTVIDQVTASLLANLDDELSDAG